MYAPQLVSMMKVSGRRKNATLETYNSEFVVEAETSDGEQAPLFRSGVGILHCDV